MKLIFRGHDDRYAIEQSLLAFFPEERPVYETAEAGEDDCAYVSLTEGKRYATGVTSIHYHGKTARGVSRAVLTDAPDEYERERLRQRALKLSFFKAARDITGVTPSWGALTGIRPGKLARAMLEQGETDRVLRDTYFVSPERRRLAIETARAGLKAKRDLRPDEISLYVGIPFCPTRCAYCSFVSASVEKSFGLMEPYLASLEQEITDAARMVAETGLRIKSFYMGGGTPTIMIDELCETIDMARDTFSIGDVSSETNPNHLIPSYLDKLQGRVQRLSVGVQSFDNDLLKQMDRYDKYGSGAEILERIGEASPYFTSLNVDMIFNFPAQTEDILINDIERVVESGTSQTTFYPLMASPSGEDAMIDEYVVDYEEYPAIGSGGITYLGDNLFVNTFSVNDYNAAIAAGRMSLMGKTTFSLRDRMRYRFMMQLFGLRLDKRQFERDFGCTVEAGLPVEMAFMKASGAFDRDTRDELTLTPKGRYLMVVMMRQFFIGVNNLRDQARAALVGEERELIFG